MCLYLAISCMYVCLKSYINFYNIDLKLKIDRKLTYFIIKRLFGFNAKPKENMKQYSLKIKLKNKNDKI